VICVIPARYGSTRFPGKPLAPVLGKPLVRWVWEKARLADVFDEIIIATDDRRIFDAAVSFGARAMMTSRSCASGTDRAAEVSAKIKPDYTVNLQGDEPLIQPAVISKTVHAIMRDRTAVVSTPVCYVKDGRQPDPNTAKVVFDKNGYALYFSRLPIPAVFNQMPCGGYYKHIGLYAYRADFLKKFVRMDRSMLEKKEKLEQLRILENGYRIKVVCVKHDTVPVDSPDDIRKVERILK
jgi:3-deoxy-manno-octulosonate cytidylyltransferase (CMP-KDO synthetase)